MTEQLKASESLTIIDDDTWVWEITHSALRNLRFRQLKAPSNLNLRENWKRFQNAPFIIVHWENKLRPAGATIEEILEIDTSQDPTNRIIIVTTNPLHEDVVYFSELGLSRVVRARNRREDFKKTIEEIRAHIEQIASPSADDESRWRRLRLAVDRLPDNATASTIIEFQNEINKWDNKTGQPSARILEAQAAMALKSGHHEQATRLAMQAIDLKPNFFRAWKTLAHARRRAGDHAEAYALLQKMHLRNRASITRLTSMGEELLALNDLEKAEWFFSSAIKQDPNCAAALNGLAELNFIRGCFDIAKELLAKSSNAHNVAAKFNRFGIELVRQEKYSDALEHYTKAQYVLPEQSRAHQIYYNIGLCYLKWGKPQTAKHFVQLAVIKNPGYEKAKRLLENFTTEADAAAHEPEAI